MASITPIVQVGTTDISSYVERGPTKSRGGERNVKSDPIIGSNRAVFWEEGRKPISWDLGLLFRTTLADQIGTSDTVTALIDDLAGDQDTDLFYPGRDDRFAVIEKGSVHDPYIRRGGGGANLYKDATLYSKATELYGATPSSWSPADEDLPITQAIGYDGNAASGGSLSIAPLLFDPVDCTGLTKANGTLEIDIRAVGDPLTGITIEITSSGVHDSQEWSKNVLAEITDDGEWHHYEIPLSDWVTTGGELVVSEIDYVRLYGASADEMQISWRNAIISFGGNDYPLSAGAPVNLGTLDAPLYSLALTARMAGAALEFDGSNDYLTAGAVDLSGNSLSIEMWIYPMATVSGFPGIVEYGNWYDDASTGEFLIQQINGSPATLQVVLGRVAGPPNYQSNSWATAFSTITWHHVVVTFDVTGNAVIAYLDGAKLGATWTPTTAMGAFTAETLDFARRQYASGATFGGSMAAVRIWGRVLSAAEALAAYSGEAVSNTSLILEYDFCEGQGGTVYDLSGNSNDGTLTNFADTSAGYGDSHDGGWLTSIGPVSPALEMLDEDNGDAEMYSLGITPSLMTAEALVQDRFGQISQTYVDTFTATIGRPAFDNGYFWADGYCYAKYIDSEIVLTSLISGRVGEEITIAITDTDQASTTVSVSGYDITVDLETSGGDPVATAQEVIDVINADEDASALVTATLADGEDGTTVLDTQAETALALNVDVTGGALVIEDDREAEYHLTGLWPIKAGGLLVTFTPTLTGTLTGSDVLALEASANSGSTWETVIDSNNAAWTDGEEMEVYVPDSIASGETEIWIRFVCPTSATSLSIDDLAIYQERAVSDSEVPKIPVGSTYKGQIGGTGWLQVSEWEFRNRYKP